MNIGDRVRALRGTEEGIVTGFPSKETIEVEIEDGFRIPMLRKELVLVATDETKHFEGSSTSNQELASKDDGRSATGIYLIFAETSSQFLELQLINNTEYKLAVAVHKKLESEKLYGLKADVMAPKTALSLGHFDLKKFESWPPVLLQVLYFADGSHKPMEPLNRSITFKASTFYKSKGKAPLLGREAYVFQIDASDRVLNREQIREQMMEASPGSDPSQEQIEQPPAIVDLHIEKLTKSANELSPAEIVRMQQEHFEQMLDRAIATSMPEITFIHGVGSGALREYIHKRLSKHQDIAYFEDAQKERFGFGATLVRIH